MRSFDITVPGAGIVVAGFALFLVGLAVVIVTKPSLAERFLGAFASSARTHYAEQGVRLLVGVAIVAHARSMRFPELFTAFGWLMVVSTVGLLFTPWQWHHRFAARVMPPVYRQLQLFGFGSLALGALFIYGLSKGG